MASLHIANAQNDSTSVYENLEVRKVYLVELNAFTQGSREVYTANGKRVSPETYMKYYEAYNNFDSCCPCILKFYDIKDRLTEERVSCTDCPVGWWKEYHDNGNLKATGQFKENPTNDWDYIWDRRYCGVPNGLFTYFDKKGDTLYSELWDNGKFIEQIPEQSKAEIWDMTIHLDGNEVDTTAVPIERVHDIKFTPYFKNSNRRVDLIVRISISAVDSPYYSEDFKLNSFHQIDVKEIIDELGIPGDRKTGLNISVYHNNEFIKHFSIDLIR